MTNNTGADKLAAPRAKLLDLVSEGLHLKHDSIRAEQAYVHSIKRYILFHDKRHLREMNKSEVEAF